MSATQLQNVVSNQAVANLLKVTERGTYVKMAPYTAKVALHLEVGECVLFRGVSHKKHLFPVIQNGLGLDDETMKKLRSERLTVVGPEGRQFYINLLNRSQQAKRGIAEQPRLIGRVA